jgi:hypothetical protein
MPCAVTVQIFAAKAIPAALTSLNDENRPAGEFIPT